MFASCFYVLFKFRFVREATQGPPLVNPLKPLRIMSFFIYNANYFIKFLKQNYFINGLKTGRLYICMYVFYIRTSTHAHTHTHTRLFSLSLPSFLPPSLPRSLPPSLPLSCYLSSCRTGQKAYGTQRLLRIICPEPYTLNPKP